MILGLPGSKRCSTAILQPKRGSHVTTDLIGFCDTNPILLAIFLPHATHSLQPLAKHYTTELNRQLQRSQGHRMTRRRRGLMNCRQLGRSKSSNSMLQPYKNPTIQLKRLSEKLYTLLEKF